MSFRFPMQYMYKYTHIEHRQMKSRSMVIDLFHLSGGIIQWFCTEFIPTYCGGWIHKSFRFNPKNFTIINSLITTKKQHYYDYRSTQVSGFRHNSII